MVTWLKRKKLFRRPVIGAGYLDRHNRVAKAMLLTDHANIVNHRWSTWHPTRVSRISLLQRADQQILNYSFSRETSETDIRIPSLNKDLEYSMAWISLLISILQTSFTFTSIETGDENENSVTTIVFGVVGDELFDNQSTGSKQRSSNIKHD